MQTIRLLGYSGLIPFILLPLMYYLNAVPGRDDIRMLYTTYSALILGFMAGVLWPVLHKVQSAHASIRLLAVAAVSIPVLSIILLLLAKPYFVLLQAVLFALLRFCEYQLGINAHYPHYYQKLRNQLTMVVVLSHLGFYSIL